MAGRLRYDPGSFRDPMSRVLVRDDQIFRGLVPQALEDFNALRATSFYADAVAAGKLIGSELLDEPDIGDESAEWAAVLRHERVPFVSYPYEWTFEMLKDAALLQLELTAGALEERLLPKDASSYNLQFIGAAPVFIDVGSFEKLRPGENWYGLRQFFQLFLYPLMLTAYRDVPFQPWLRGSLDGITAVDCRNVLSRRDRFRRGVWSTVVAQAKVPRTPKGAGAAGRGPGPALIAAQLKTLEKRVRSLTWKRASSTWSEYSDRGHYTDADLTQKAEFVARVAAAKRRRMVWDIGANDGYFSEIAARSADHVLAIDLDPLVVDRLYQRLRREGHRRIQPLFMNLADPSPGLGWRGRERPPVWERSRPDLVLCLAVVHHVAITNTVPLDEFVDFLADLRVEAVVEFPTRDDPMVELLLRNKRAGLFDSYDLPPFEKSLTRHFDIAERIELASGTRVLFHVRPHGGV